MDEAEHPYDECYEWFTNVMSNVCVPNIDMAETFEQLVSKKLDDYCAIFIGGGNAYKLLKGLKESGAFYKIQEYIKQSGVVVGCSAGAVICGNDIDIIKSMDENQVNLIDTKGFDVLSGISIFPHYMNSKSKLTDEQNKARMDKFTNEIVQFSLVNGDVYAIPEEDTIFIDGNNVEIIGTKNYYVFKNGSKQEIKINS